MSTKIYANARFGFREDTLENWSKNNPILEKGEPAVVRDGQNGEWLKIGDGITDFNRLPWKTGPKGEQGIQGPQGIKGDKGEQGIQGVAGKDAVTDQTYDPNSENAQSGKAVFEALSIFTPKEKNYELIATIKVAPDVDGKLPPSIIFSQDSNGNPFELTDFYLSALCGSPDGNNAKVALLVNGRPVFGNVSIGLSTSIRGWYLNYIDLNGSGALAIAPTWTNGTTHPTGYTTNSAGFTGGVVGPTFTGFKPITNVNFSIIAGTAKTFIEGSEFKLYGVRK